MATSYNSWLQTQRWGDRIAELMRDEKYLSQPAGATY
jgi:hypothetical protein